MSFALRTQIIRQLRKFIIAHKNPLTLSTTSVLLCG